MYSLEISTDNFNIDRIINAAKQERILIAAGNILREIIIDQTEQGIFLNGKNFQYSKSRKYQRKKKGLQTNFVDMIDTGTTVIQGIQLRTLSYNEVQLFIKKDTDAGRREQWNRKRYPFFGINQHRTKLLDERLNDEIKIILD